MKKKLLATLLACGVLLQPVLVEAKTFAKHSTKKKLSKKQIDACVDKKVDAFKTWRVKEGLDSNKDEVMVRMEILDEFERDCKRGK